MFYNSVKKIISFVESKLNPTAKIIIGVSVLVLIFQLAYDPVDTTKATVMITRLDGRSGGSGVVLNSSPGRSEILTNKHICGVVKRGGIISTPEGLKASVMSFKESNVHDLCLITTFVNMGAYTIVAPEAPKLMDRALIKGHPALLPTLLTEGIFSSNMVISVAVGFKECTEKDMLDPEKAMFCTFVGRLPLVRNYEATVVSALIMGGSSGSAIYNSNNQLSALVFAGSGGRSVSFAFAVPHGAIKNFLTKEVKTLPEQYPNYTDQEEEQSNIALFNKKTVEFCSQPETHKNQVCLSLNNGMVE